MNRESHQVIKRTNPLPFELDPDFDGPVYEWIHKVMERHRDMEELDRLGY